MEKLLSKELGNIVEETVKHYKDDLNQDLEVLMDKNKYTDTFIFLVRDNGTHLYEKSKLYIEEAGERVEFLYFEEQFKKAFEVVVTRRGRKHSYGTVNEVKLKSLIDDVKKNSESYSNVEVKIIKNDDTILETVFKTDDSYREYLVKNNLTYDDVKRVYYLRYFN